MSAFEVMATLYNENNASWWTFASPFLLGGITLAAWKKSVILGILRQQESASTAHQGSPLPSQELAAKHFPAHYCTGTCLLTTESMFIWWGRGRWGLVRGYPHSLPLCLKSHIKLPDTSGQAGAWTARIGSEKLKLVAFAIRLQREASSDMWSCVWGSRVERNRRCRQGRQQALLGKDEV